MTADQLAGGASASITGQNSASVWRIHAGPSFGDLRELAAVIPQLRPRRSACMAISSQSGVALVCIHHGRRGMRTAILLRSCRSSLPGRGRFSVADIGVASQALGRFPGDLHHALWLRGYRTSGDLCRSGPGADGSLPNTPIPEMTRSSASARFRQHTALWAGPHLRMPSSRSDRSHISRAHNSPAGLLCKLPASSAVGELLIHFHSYYNTSLIQGVSVDRGCRAIRTLSRLSFLD